MKRAYIMAMAFIPTLWLLFWFGSVLLYTLFKAFYHHGWTLYYIKTLFSPTYVNVMLRTGWVATITTFFCIILAYPIVYALSFHWRQKRWLILPLFILPFVTGTMLRNCAWMDFLRSHGWLCLTLNKLGLFKNGMLFTNFSMILGIILTHFPIMLFMLDITVRRIDPQLLEAAFNLGASRLRVFWTVILPLSWHGLKIAIAIVFLPAMTLFYIPNLFGGGTLLLLGNMIEDHALVMHDWHKVYADSLLIMLIVCLLGWLFLNIKNEV
jgi:spermidine/putrescine transport system permease protein